MIFDFFKKEEIKQVSPALETFIKSSSDVEREYLDIIPKPYMFRAYARVGKEIESQNFVSKNDAQIWCVLKHEKHGN